MSDYSDEDDFENYDDDADDFEEPGDDDYDVLPGAAPMQVQKQQQQPIPAKRASTAGAAGIRAPLAAAKPLVIPLAPQLTDVEMAARRFRLAAAVKKMAKVRKRLQVVEMDDLFQMSSLSLHDMFSMGRGTYAGLVPAACQTNDDAKEEAAQTDEVPSRTYACQAPEDRSHLVDEAAEDDTAAAPPAAALPSAAVAAASPAAPARAHAKAGGRGTAGAGTHTFPVIDPLVQKKLGEFMQWAGPLVLAGLGMAPCQKALDFGGPAGPVGGLSGGRIRLAWDALLANRPVAGLAFSPLPSEAAVLVAYGPVGVQLGAGADLLKDHSLASKGCLCLWDLSAPSRPRHVMFSEGAPTCCAFAPAPFTHIVVAGMAEGGICVWDLEELPARHPTELLQPTPAPDTQWPDQCAQGEVIAARRPSYSTEAAPGGDDGSGGVAAGPIVAVATAAAEGGARTTPCTVVALTEWGEVQVYTCSLLASNVGSTGTDVDIGMRIGSRVRLIRNGGTVKLGMQALKPNSPPQASPSYCLAILGSSSGSGSTTEAHSSAGRGGSDRQGTSRTACQVLVGSEGGKVLRGGWAGTAPAPKLYLADDHKSQAVAVEPNTPAAVLGGAVTCIAVSPAQPLAFLCGLSDGSVSLHRIDRGSAVAVWPSLGTGGQSVRSVAWVPSRPCCFLALDAACTLHHFDLARSQSGPTVSEAYILHQGGAPPSFPTAMAAAALRPGGNAAPPPLPCFALGQDDGGVDVHRLSPAVGGLPEAGVAEGAGDAMHGGLAALNEFLGFVGSGLQ